MDSMRSGYQESLRPTPEKSLASSLLAGFKKPSK
jgi:hypothetical protein